MPAPTVDELNALRKEAHELLVQKRYREAQILFEQLFDGADPAIASCLGFIHSRPEISEYDAAKAIHYYDIAAQGGDTYAQYALAGLLTEHGETDKALDWYKKASELGNSACSYKLYLIHRSRGDKDAAERYLGLAIEQGNPAAIQKLAIRYAAGRFGLKNIPWGVYLYFKNIPSLIKFARENVG